MHIEVKFFKNHFEKFKLHQSIFVSSLLCSRGTGLFSQLLETNSISKFRLPDICESVSNAQIFR